MKAENQTSIVHSPSGRKLIISRTFNAPHDRVWEAWTNSNMLDQWWAPKPWKTVTKNLDFSEGGKWLYAMQGPEGEKHWCRVDFESIMDKTSFNAVNGFCNEQGTFTGGMPQMDWHVTFSASGEDVTEVNIEIKFDSAADLDQIVEMGFKEGFSMALKNLDNLLS